MTDNRAQLDHALDDLEAKLPDLQRDCDHGSVMDALGREMRFIESRISANDYAHVMGRINRMLDEAGIVPRSPRSMP